MSALLALAITAFAVRGLWSTLKDAGRACRRFGSWVASEIARMRAPRTIVQTGPSHTQRICMQALQLAEINARIALASAHARALSRPTVHSRTTVIP